MESNVLHTYRDDAMYFHHTRTEHPDPEDFSFRSHSHSACEIYYFLEGEAAFAVEGTVHALEKGTLILMDRGQTHNILIRSSEKPYERTAILFQPMAMPKGFESVFRALQRGSNCFRLTEKEQLWMEECIRMLEAPAADGVAPAVQMSAVIGIILAKAATLLENSVFPEPQGDDVVPEIIRYINANLSSEWHLEDMERALFRDKAYLNRRFRQVMGCSIWEYVLRRRVFAAQQQLYLSGSVAEAFRVSGFQDYSSFYRRYRKYIGLSPSEDLKKLDPARQPAVR